MKYKKIRGGTNMVKEQYHLSLYQTLVENCIEDKLLDYSLEKKMNDKEFNILWNNYNIRLEHLIQVRPDWKEYYTQLMTNAYKGATGSGTTHDK